MCSRTILVIFFFFFFTYAGVFPPLNEITQAFVCFKLVYFFSGGLEIAQDGIIPWIRGFPWLFLGSILHTQILGGRRLGGQYRQYYTSFTGEVLNSIKSLINSPKAFGEFQTLLSSFFLSSSSFFHNTTFLFLPISSFSFAFKL